IDLSDKAVSSRAYLRGRMGRRDFASLKRMTEFCSTPVHIPEKRDRDASVMISPAVGFPLESVRFSPPFNAEAELFRLDNPAFEDREILAAVSAGFMGQDLSILAKKIRSADAETINSIEFGRVAKEGAFPLSILTLVSGLSGSGRSIACSLSLERVGASVLSPSDQAWPSVGLGGLAEPSSADLEYVGLAVDTGPGTCGTFTVIGHARCGRNAVIEGAGAQILDIPFERDAVASVVSSGKGIIQKGLQVALSIIGYREWGSGFLRQADR
ncbi:MAG: hypothetical protein U0R44_07355, partial [Candidatus Micrarchaeia archaeon]